LNSPTAEELEVLYRLEKRILKVWLFDTESPSSSQLQAEIPAEITDLANQRLQAKQEKNYALADELRNQIQEAGYVIKDVSWGFEIEKN
jgi:cysteinyl-tRNA synthetase